MIIDDAFEQKCKDLYSYYSSDYSLSREDRTLQMLRATGEFWSRQQVNYLLMNMPENVPNLTFVEFRRLAKESFIKSKEIIPLSDDFGNVFRLHRNEINEIANAFDTVEEFYTGNKDGGIPMNLFYDILTLHEDAMPPQLAKQVLGQLHVYNKNITLRSFLKLVSRDG